ncbi:hypothetical protein CW304_29610, partial [Bacillus sp. UFRGS-B20]
RFLSIRNYYRMAQEGKLLRRLRTGVKTKENLISVLVKKAKHRSIKMSEQIMKCPETDIEFAMKMF